MLDKYLEINPEVKSALDEGKAVVALESTTTLTCKVNPICVI